MITLHQISRTPFQTAGVPGKAKKVQEGDATMLPSNTKARTKNNSLLPIKFIRSQLLLTNFNP